MPKTTGTTKQKIIAVLDENGPQTAVGIAELSGLSPRVVRVCVSSMITRWGGVVRVGQEGRHHVYGLPGVHEAMVRRARAALRGPVAGPRYVGDIHTTLRRNPFEHMELALAARGAA